MSKTKEVNAAIDIEGDPIVEGQIVVRQETPVARVNPFSHLISKLDLSSGSSGLDTASFLAVLEESRKEEDRQARREFNIAMARAQSECQAVVRAAEVNLGKDKGGYKYAALEDIDEMLRPIMTKYGFSVTYDRVPRQAEGGGMIITGTLRHSGGHEITGSFALPLDSGPGRNNLQAAGSTDSYGRKYILMGFFNIVRKNADDDGFAAGIIPVTGEQAAKLIQLVDEAKIATSKDHAERRAEVKAWFTDVLSYDITSYTAIRQEDYARLARMLKSLADKAAAATKEEMKV
jgi:hypothetical protein